MWYWPVSVVSLTSSKSLKSVPSLICVLVLGVLFFFCKCAMCVRGDKPGGRSCRGNKFLMTFKRKRIKKDKLVLFISFGWCDYLFYLSIPCEQRCKEGDFLCLHITLPTDSRCKRLCIVVYHTHNRRFYSRSNILTKTQLHFSIHLPLISRFTAAINIAVQPLPMLLHMPLDRGILNYQSQTLMKCIAV